MLNYPNKKIRIRKSLPPRSILARPKKQNIDATRKAAEIALWLREKKAFEVMAFDLKGLCSVAEAMLVATAASIRHGQGIADHLLKRVREGKLEMLGMEGYAAGQWILVDLNDVLVHIFQKDTRRTINLEGLWSDAVTIELPEE